MNYPMFGTDADQESGTDENGGYKHLLDDITLQIGNASWFLDRDDTN